MAALRKLTLDDLWGFKTLGKIAVSPDGRRVAFVMHSADKESNENRSTIYMLFLDEHGHALDEPRQLTSGLKNDTNPAWAPDSHRLLFVSDREEKNQLWLIDTNGGEARKLTTMLHGVQEAAWSLDGQWIAFIAPAASDDEDNVLTGRKTLDEAARKQREERERTSLRTVTKIFYRNDGVGLFEKFSHLFLLPAPTTADSPIKPESIRRLTRGEYQYTNLAWTPDSQEIGVLRFDAGKQDANFVFDLWAIDRENGEQRCLTDGTLEIEGYTWSPDGKAALVIGAKDQMTHGRSLQRLYLVTRKGNVGDRILTLTPDLDRETFPVVRTFGEPGPANPVWSSDGQTVYFMASQQATVYVYSLNILWRRLQQLTRGETNVNFIALTADKQSLLIAQELPTHPWELYLLPLDGRAGHERLTHLYDQLLGEYELARTERIRYQGANNDEIDGWLTLPVGAKKGVRYPLIVNVHGGPHWAYGIGIDPTMQYWAAQGFAVFYCNPHGSTSYGETFLRQVEGDWGGWDFQDIMRGVDECIARGVADPERLLVTGYSYGGYMSMFIIGQTNRFKAAVPMAGISNLNSFIGTSDIGFWQAAEAKGYPWDPARADYYRERSPLTYASRVITPTLFLHPENDLRCPIEQSEQFYMTLKMMGKVPVEFVRVPGAWHVGQAKPSQSYAYSEIMLNWFRKYVDIRPQEYADVE